MATTLVNSETTRRDDEPLHIYRARVQQVMWGDFDNRDSFIKAKSLLIAHLSEEQRKELDKYHGFTVKGTDTYFITRGMSISVLREVEGRYVKECVSCIVDFVPDFDQMLAIKLLIETNEDEYKRLRNVFGYL